MPKKYENNILLEPNKTTELEVTDDAITRTDISLTEARKLLPANLRHLKNLNLKEYKFLAIYCSNGFNAVEACKQAGYVERTKARYNAIAYTLLQRKEIVEAIRLYINTIIDPYKDKIEIEVLSTYYKRATYSISDFYDDNLYAKPLDMIPKELQCCIDDIDIKRVGTATRYRYVLPNRDTALQSLYRFITGKDLTSDSMQLPEESMKRVQNIYNTVITKETVQPKNVRSKNNVSRNNN